MRRHFLDVMSFYQCCQIGIFLGDSSAGQRLVHAAKEATTALKLEAHIRVSKPNRTKTEPHRKPQYFHKIMVCSFLQEIQPKNGQNCSILKKYIIFP